MKPGKNAAPPGNLSTLEMTLATRNGSTSGRPSHRTSRHLKNVARAWHAKQKKKANWTPSYAEKILVSLVHDVFPFIGRRPISGITAKDMLEVLSKIEARGAHETASRVKQRCNSVFNYAITKLHTTGNPTIPLQGSFQAPKSQHHARLKLTELPELLRKVPTYDGHKQTALAIKMLAYAFVRTIELRGALWSEFDLKPCGAFPANG